MLQWRKISVLVLLAVTAVFVFSAPAQTVFDQQKQEYLDTMGEDLRTFPERIWSWLELMKNGTLDGTSTYVTDIDGVSKPILDVVHNIIISWGSIWSGPGYAPYVHAWHWGEWQSSVMLIWVLYAYGDVIYPEDKEFLINLYASSYTTDNMAPGAPNSQISDWVARYLYLQYHKDVYVNYSTDPPPSENVIPFDWNGKHYELGQKYNGFELSEAYLSFLIKHWIFYGNNEFDSPIYSWCIVHCMIALETFAEDPLMKKKAEMFVDFFLLDAILDFGGNQWGGKLGRAYEEVYRRGACKFYWDVFWGGPRASHDPPRNIFFSDYRLPDVIFDIGDLSDEPDNYYHLNMEYNKSITKAVDTGKWNYVTKFYSLGGGAASNWQLAILSENDVGSYGRPGIPFRLWINTKAEGDDVANPVDYMSYLTTGEKGYQYKNAMFLQSTILHMGLRSNTFDVDYMERDWRFLQEGRTMVAVRIRPDIYTAALEVAIEGVDYANLNEFKAAVFENCDLGTGKFITSRNDWIGYGKIPDKNTLVPIVKKGGVGSYEFVFTFPFKRIEAVDHKGKRMVWWSGNTMIVSKHGKKIEYDFENWTKTVGTAPVDNTPPTPPTGLVATQKQ